MAMFNAPYTTPTTIVDQIEIVDLMIVQYNNKIAELTAAVTVFTAQKAALNVQLKAAENNQNYPTL
jgi:hypothetical protein